jgi:hypothetical protein
MTDDIPAPVAAFLAGRMASRDDLEVLVVLMLFGERWFTPAQVGAQVGLAPGRARQVLDRFVSVNLVDIRALDAVRYQFRPATPELEAGARAVGDLYRANPAALLRCIAVQPRRQPRRPTRLAGRRA